MSRFNYAQYFNDINVLADIQFMPGEKPYIDRPSETPAPKDILLYLGCNVLRTGHLVKAVVSVLTAMGIEFNTAAGPAHCCGIIHHQNGDAGRSRRLASNSLNHFQRYGASKLLMWCPSCMGHYDDVVSKFVDQNLEYEHVTEFIVRNLHLLPIKRRVERRAAIHYHDASAQSFRDTQNVRTILKAVPGIELFESVDLTAQGGHCNPKSISFYGRERWRARISQIFAVAEAAKVDSLVTVYHSCQREMCPFEKERPFEIVNYITIVAEALGLQFTDEYKSYRNLGSISSIYDAVERHATANGLAPEPVCAVLERSFGQTSMIDANNPS